MILAWFFSPDVVRGDQAWAFLVFLGQLLRIDLITLERGKCPVVSRYVRTYVCLQKVCPISVKFGMYIEVNG